MRRGFTLIELLVVIAIIAILAAILFPVFARARAKAKSIKCLSNMKEVTLGCLMYADDYDEVTGKWEQGPSGVCYTWVTQVMPYVKNHEIFGCPSNSMKYRQDNRAAWATKWYSSYAVNGVRHGITSTNLEGSTYMYCYRPIYTIQLPAECLMLAEVEGSARGPTNIWRTWAGLAPEACFLHNEGANVGFFDGHAKWVNRDVLHRPPDDTFWSGGA